MNADGSLIHWLPSLINVWDHCQISTLCQFILHFIVGGQKQLPQNSYPNFLAEASNT